MRSALLLSALVVVVVLPGLRGAGPVRELPTFNGRPVYLPFARTTRQECCWLLGLRDRPRLDQPIYYPEARPSVDPILLIMLQRIADQQSELSMQLLLHDRRMEEGGRRWPREVEPFDGRLVERIERLSEVIVRALDAQRVSDREVQAALRELIRGQDVILDALRDRPRPVPLPSPPPRREVYPEPYYDRGALPLPYVPPSGAQTPAPPASGGLKPFRYSTWESDRK